MSGTAVNRERYTESTRFGRLPATVSISIREPGSALTHFAGLILMAVGAGPLIMRASIYGSVRTVIGVIVFVLTSCMLYAASTAYHTVVLDLKHTTLFRKLDHVSISVMIAGTYLPVCLRPAAFGASCRSFRLASCGRPLLLGRGSHLCASSEEIRCEAYLFRIP